MLTHNAANPTVLDNIAVATTRAVNCLAHVSIEQAANASLIGVPLYLASKSESIQEYIYNHFPLPDNIQALSDKVKKEVEILKDEAPILQKIEDIVAPIAWVFSAGLAERVLQIVNSQPNLVDSARLLEASFKAGDIPTVIGTAVLGLAVSNVALRVPKVVESIVNQIKNSEIVMLLDILGGDKANRGDTSDEQERFE